MEAVNECDCAIGAEQTTVVYDRAEKIDYHQNPTEFEIQSQLLHSLLGMGFKVRGEVCGSGGRYDLVVFSKCLVPVLIIEVKASRADRNKPGTKAQIARYRRESLLTCLLICGQAEADEFLGEVQRYGLKIAPHLAGRRKAMGAANELVVAEAPATPAEATK